MHTFRVNICTSTALSLKNTQNKITICTNYARCNTAKNAYPYNVLHGVALKLWQMGKLLENCSNHLIVIANKVTQCFWVGFKFPTFKRIRVYFAYLLLQISWVKWVRVYLYIDYIEIFVCGALSLLLLLLLLPVAFFFSVFLHFINSLFYFHLVCYSTNFNANVHSVCTKRNDLIIMKLQYVLIYKHVGCHGEPVLPFSFHFVSFRFILCTGHDTICDTLFHLLI